MNECQVLNLWFERPAPDITTKVYALTVLQSLGVILLAQ